MAGLLDRVKGSRLARDSFWAVFGNGLGYGLLLLAGIFIARLLGSEVYGEYGLVKTTMIYIAGFATFGLGITSTRYVSNALTFERSKVRQIASDAVKITFCFSFCIAVAIVAAAAPIAHWLDTPDLISAFRVLSVIIVCKAMNTTQNGVLAGFGDFKAIARNSVISGGVMLLFCVPLTLWLGLTGSFISLTASQAVNVVLNYFSFRRNLNSLTDQTSDASTKKELFLFSFPIAIQELNYTVCSWGAIALLTIYSSVGQVGIYTATAQWNGVITFIPGLLQNVLLSHISGDAATGQRHRHTLRNMLTANFLSSAIPFVIVFLLAGWIGTFYGPTFKGIVSVMRIMTLATIFSACSSVYYSELISKGHNWLSLICRLIQEFTLLFSGWILLAIWRNVSGATCMAVAYLASSIMSFLLPFLTVKFLKLKTNKCLFLKSE